MPDSNNTQAVVKKSISAKVKPFPPDMDAALRRMNDVVCYIDSTSDIARIDPKKMKGFKIPTMSCSTFVNEAFRNIKIGREYVAKHWMDWIERRTVAEIVYAPGDDRFTSDGNLNAWFPSITKAREGDVSLFLYYIDALMESEPEFKDWLIAWLAYHLQYPRTKILSAVMCWSFEQGNGKSTLGWIMRQIYGHHNSSLIRTRFPDRFNSYAENVQFIFADEMTPVRKTDQQDMIKTMVTQTHVSIEHKGKKPYEIPDIASIYFTSNHPNAFDLKPEDRRFFVHNVGRNRLTATWFKQTFYPWLNKQANIDAIYYYLINVDLSKPIVGGDPESDTPTPFNPSAWAPRTEARAQMISDNRDDTEAWVWELRENPVQILGEANANRTIFTSEELFSLYREQSGDSKASPQAFRLKLSHALVKLNKGYPINFSTDFRPRLYSTDSTKSNLDSAQVKLCWAQERE